ncbi:MAG TPA: glycine cleavage T C-terminal barrel domain-containing protein [Planctomycetaceae bacterium]|nr:glycine cleavage T C-terminal barrel domain-containing protein [Planctomycetaceae bacterium]
MPSPPLDPQQRAAGADPRGEYAAARASAAVFDVSDRVQVELTGGDRVKFLHNFCTNDVKSLAPGRGCEAFLTNGKGRILGHVLLFATEHTLWIDEIGTPEEVLLGHLDRYIITEDVQLHGRSGERGELFVSGEQSAERLGALHVDASKLALYEHAALAARESFVAIRRADLLGAPGFLVSIPRDRLVEIWQALTDAGCRPAGGAAYEALRIEAGTPLYGVDLTDDNIAQEAARTPLAISFTKGCYLGQEPIARLDALGHTNRELRGLKLADGPVPGRGAAVMAASEDVGRITSAAAGPLDDRPVALALLKARHARPGTELHVETAAGPVAASVFWPFDP